MDKPIQNTEQESNEKYYKAIEDNLCQEGAKMQIAFDIDVPNPVYRSVSKRNKTDYRIPGPNISSVISSSDITWAYREKLVSSVLITDKTSSENGKIYVTEEQYKDIVNNMSHSFNALKGYVEGLSEARSYVDYSKEYTIEELRRIAEVYKESGNDYLSGRFGTEYMPAYRTARAVALLDASDMCSQIVLNLETKREQENGKKKSSKQTEK